VVIQKVLEKRLTRVNAGELLGLSPRQVTRLCDAFANDGQPEARQNASAIRMGSSPMAALCHTGVRRARHGTR
jgi:hypothetical protein